MPRTLFIILAALLFTGCLPYQTVGNPNQNNLDLNSPGSPSSQPTPTGELQVNLFGTPPAGGQNPQIAGQSVTSTPDQTINMQDILKPGPSQQFFALLRTSKGDIKIELYPQVAPTTVVNFVGLSEGTISWQDPKTNQKVTGRPLYSNLIFHRVIKDFMIQGGDPLGNGTGGPGYKFEDEVSDQYTFDGPGILAMANSGPNTNGSQFFITHAATPWLNGKHTIFGKVVEGMEVVDAIATSPVGENDKPVEDITLNMIDIIRQ